MSLIGRLIGKLLKRGSITLIEADGSRATYGKGGGRHLTIRFGDRKVAFDIMRNPRLGVGEAYMDGRLTIEDGTMLDLLDMVASANRWEEGGKGKALAKGRVAVVKAFFRRNDPRKSRRNVAHHYDLSDDLYDTFLDAD